MFIKIKRYHLILTICSVVSLTSVSIFSIQGFHSLQTELPKNSTLPAGLDITEKTADPARPQKPLRTVKETKKAQAANPVIALTFDDGPHPQYTDRLLKILNDNEVHATFFMVGKQIELHPELAQKIFNQGHELANHTYSHPDLRTLSPQQLHNELDKTHRLVESITEQQMKFFRPPGGQYNQEVVEQAKELNYTIVLWNVFPQDHSNPPPQTILTRVLNNAPEKAVVLLHSGVENTLSVLPELILNLRKRGYSFATLSQMDSSFDLSSLKTNNKKRSPEQSFAKLASD